MNTSPSFMAPPLLLPAGFWWRVLAFFLDFMILSVVFALLWGAGERTGLGTTILCWLYFAFCESSAWQATLGKRACGLIVTDESMNSISFARASGRHFAKYITAATLGLGLLLVLFTRQRQTLHDVLASTVVIRMR